MGLHADLTHTYERNDRVRILNTPYADAVGETGRIDEIITTITNKKVYLVLIDGRVSTLPLLQHEIEPEDKP